MTRKPVSRGPRFSGTRVVLVSGVLGAYFIDREGGPPVIAGLVLILGVIAAIAIWYFVERKPRDIGLDTTE